MLTDKKLIGEGLTIREGFGMIRRNHRGEPMIYQPKTKSYRVILQNTSGEHSMMLILGCLDEAECLKHVEKVKEKHLKIAGVQEISKAA